MKSRCLHHAADVVGFLARVGIPVKHSQLFVEQVFCFVVHAQVGCGERTECEFLGLAKEAFGRYGTQSVDCLSRLVAIANCSSRSGSRSMLPMHKKTADGVVCPRTLGAKRRDLKIDWKQVIVFPRHPLCGLECIEKVGDNRFRSRKASDHRIFDQTVLKGIPGSALSFETRTKSLLIL